LGIEVDWQPTIRILVAVSIIALHSFRLSYTVLFLSTTISVREEQLVKAPFPIPITLAGIVREVRDLQSEKALFPIFVTVFGIAIAVREEQQ
jgi:hypothetical protein